MDLEYIALDFDPLAKPDQWTARLAQLGREGWILQASTPITDIPPLSDIPVTTKVRMVFMRRRP